MFIRISDFVKVGYFVGGTFIQEALVESDWMMRQTACKVLPQSRFMAML